MKLISPFLDFLKKHQILEIFPLILLFGIVYQILFLLLMDKIVFFSRTQVINDTVYSSFLIIILYIGYSLSGLGKSRWRIILFIFTIFVSVVLVIVLLNANYFYIFVMLFLFLGILGGLIEWFFNRKTPEKVSKIAEIMFVVLIPILMCIFISSNPYKYDKLIINNIHEFSGNYRIKYMNDNYLFFYRESTKENEREVINIIPITDNNLNALYITTDSVDLGLFKTISTIWGSFISSRSKIKVDYIVNKTSINHTGDQVLLKDNF